MTPSSSTVPSEPKTSTRTVVMLVELRCYLCANTVGVLETHHWPSFGPALLRTRPESPAMRIADWRRLRCAKCSGNVYPDEISTARVYPPDSWAESEQPRRGRPPKWLVEQRKAARGETSD